MIQKSIVFRQRISIERPELLNLFETYHHEALAARKFLDSDLQSLDPESKILEIGGGIMLLAAQLAAEGFKVTSVEPIGLGFGDIDYLKGIVDENCTASQLPLSTDSRRIEEFKSNHKFDYAFSINVMEHLIDPYRTLADIFEVLSTSGRYRFFCPNYDFPYEPHFSKWMLKRRNRAFYLPKSSALDSRIDLTDSEGLYDSLNFITVSKLINNLQAGQIDLLFNRKAFLEIVNRSLTDFGLGSRHPRLVRLVKFANLLGFLKVAEKFPVKLQPVMDVTAIRSLHELNRQAIN
jgi:SAM-dependent methyltransferase